MEGGILDVCVQPTDYRPRPTSVPSSLDIGTVYVRYRTPCVRKRTVRVNSFTSHSLMKSIWMFKS